MPHPSVLLVDDEQFFLNLQREFLQESPVSVITATGGREALALAREHHPGLIVLDFRMPEMDGGACCALLKADPFLRQIPVVMVVVEGKEQDCQLAFQAGCDAVITKPLDRRTFLHTGRRFLPDVERRHPRIPLSTLAFFRKGDESHHGTIEDISLFGVYVATRCTARVDDPIRLGFILPDSDIVECDARVAWVNQGHRRIKKNLLEGFGVEFVAISVEAADRVKRYVRQHTPR